MILSSITANRHVFDGRVNGKPIRLLLNFDNGKGLRLQAVGERMITDHAALDEAFDMDEYGRIDVANVTGSLFPQLHDVEVASIQALTHGGRQVGIRVNLTKGEAFHFWSDGDELHWGNEAGPIAHDWHDGIAPTLAQYIQV